MSADVLASRGQARRDVRRATEDENPKNRGDSGRPVGNRPQVWKPAPLAGPNTRLCFSRQAKACPTLEVALACVTGVEG